MAQNGDVNSDRYNGVEEIQAQHLFPDRFDANILGRFAQLNKI